MNNKDLTIVSVVANNASTRFLQNMLKSVRRFTDFSPKIILVDSGENKNTLENLGENVTVVKHNYKLNKHTSFMHGSGLNQALAMVNTELTAIIEPDCVVLKDKWYEFDTNKYDVVAAHKGSIRGLDYHFVCFMIYKSKLFNHIDWRPLYDGSRKRGSGLYNDCGWRAEEAMPPVERILPLTFVRSDQAKFFSGPTFRYKTQEFYTPDSELIAAHFFRGSDYVRRGTSKNGVSVEGQIKTFKRIAAKIIGDKNGK